MLFSSANMPATPKINNLFLDVSQNCNISCIMCAVPRTSHLAETEPIFNFIQSNHNYFDEVRTVVIGHQAESFLNPDLFKIVKFFKDRNSQVHLVTNGKLLNRRMQEVCESDLDLLVVSVDSHHRETLEGIRRGINGLELLESLRILSQKRKKELSLRLNVCLMRRNIEHLPGIVELAVKLDIQTVFLQFMIALYPEMVPESLFFYQHISDEFMHISDDLAQRCGIRLQSPRYFASSLSTPSSVRSHCHMPFNTLYISGDGNCYVCYDYNIGNIKSDSMSEIWEGESINRFRQSILMPKPHHCQQCTYCEVQSPAHAEAFFPPHILAALPKSVIMELAQGNFDPEQIRVAICRYFPDEFFTADYRMASALKSAGDLEASKSLFTKLLAQLPADSHLQAGAHFHLGSIHFMLGNMPMALAEFQQCLRLVPDHGKARSFLQRILPD